MKTDSGHSPIEQLSDHDNTLAPFARHANDQILLFQRLPQKIEHQTLPLQTQEEGSRGKNQLPLPPSFLLG